MLVAKMVLNIIVTEGMAPSLNNSRNLALQPNLLLPTKCNATAALKAGHLQLLGVMMHKLKTITDAIVLNIPRRTIPGHCKERYKCEINCPRHTHGPSCTTAQLVNLGSIDRQLGNLGSTTSNHLMYACLNRSDMWLKVDLTMDIKNICSKNIGLHAPNIFTILGSTIHMICHLMSTKSSLL